MFPTIKFNIERWKYNPTFELYVSNMGHIRNKSKADIAPKIMENGYVVVYVYGSLNCYMLLHRVVMLTWKPTPEAENLTVDHLDHNKRNNALSNLEWVTKQENLRRAREDYLGGASLVDNDVIVKNKKKKKVRSEVVGIEVQSERWMPEEKIVLTKEDEKAVTLLLERFSNKVNNFSRKGLRTILSDIYSGKNCVGLRKWCDFTFTAIRKEI